MRSERPQTFTVPAGNGQYAPEILYLSPDDTPNTNLDLVAELSVLVESLPATAVVEVDLCKAGRSGQSAGDWNIAVNSYNATGLQALIALAAWRGIRVRCKSGGAAGTGQISASWW